MYAFWHKPNPNISDNKLLPPKDINGSGTPTVGSKPKTIEIFIK
jgi:hypothetical protein